MGFLKNIATVSMLTLLSRILGFLRDVLIAALLRPGSVADALASQSSQTFFGVSGSALTQHSFLYLVVQFLRTENWRPRIASSVLSVMILILLGFISLTQISMPFLMYAFAPGFSEDPTRLIWLSI